MTPARSGNLAQGPSVDRRSESRGDKAVDLARVRVPLEGRLREEQLAIERHLEATAGARKQRRTRNPGRPCAEEFSHQTDGLFGVVSDDAELDFEFVQPVRGVSVHASTVRRT